MTNATTLPAPMKPEDFRPARGTRRNGAELDSVRALGRENGYHGVPKRVICVELCRRCNAWLPGVQAAYDDGYEAGTAERAERLVRVAADRAEAARRRAGR